MAPRPLILGVLSALVAASLVAPAAASVGDAANVDAVNGDATTATIVTPQRLANSIVVDTRAEDPKVTFLVGLPRNSTKIAKAAIDSSTPGALTYRDHPSLLDAGKLYGASSKAVTRLRAAAKALGITVTVGKGKILARLTAPVSVWNKAYGLKMRSTAPTESNPYRTFSMVNGNDYAAAPATLRPVTAEWIPVYSEYVPGADTPGVSQPMVAYLQSLLASPGTPVAWPRNLGTLPAGTCDAPALQSKAVYAPGQIQTAYGTTALAARGVAGQGARLTIVSLGGGYDADDIKKAAECFGYTAPQIIAQRGTGILADFVNATVETNLDLITASSVITKASSITLLQASDNATTGFTDAFARMLDGSAPPDVVSISYGVCEIDYAKTVGAYISLNEDLLRMAAIVGTAVVVGAGDHGSSMCGADVAEVSGEPSVWYPASSPWVTSVGGTRLALTSANARRSERVWNDLPFDRANPFAGGGGPSAVFDRPTWQAGVTPVGPRAVPDVALLGAMRPGWPIVYGGGVYTIGGTSAGAPFLAANLAAMSAHQRARKYPSIGFPNMWLYSAARSAKSPFFDIVAGSNAVNMVGCCSAVRGYDMASGLGVPTMDRLYATLPRPAG
jgi:subtilase family serine protease